MSKQLNRLSLNRAAALVAIVVGVGGGSYGLASAASGTGTATTTTTPTTPVAAATPWGHQRSDETLLTGDALAKVTAIAMPSTSAIGRAPVIFPSLLDAAERSADTLLRATKYT